MPLPVVCESPELFLEMDALLIIQRWAGNLTRPVEVRTSYKGIQCDVKIKPIIPLVDPTAPTPCERDILDTLRASDRRMLQPELVEALEADHGESTIVKALAKMVRDGRLNNVNKRGYGLAGAKPSIEHHGDGS